ncbi:PaaX family transcriptional regulator C-terminal domain-containing protein [Geodermatophilus africanus]|uniref:PaaX family transcriptional regulator C-terminal domain-containing protein n=1 Tax=Geodermatophilus africanus TaxID=1137993 RepID=UPI003CC7A7BE
MALPAPLRARRRAHRAGRRAAGPAGPADGAAALAAHLRGLAAVRRVGAADPLLPADLRPAGWPGPEMRATWAELGDRLRAPAREQVAAVLDRPGPSQRCTLDMSG